MIIQMFEKKLSDGYFSSPAHIYENLDSLPFCTWKENIETDLTLRQKMILDAVFPQRSQKSQSCRKRHTRAKLALKFISRSALSCWC